MPDIAAPTAEETEIRAAIDRIKAQIDELTGQTERAGERLELRYQVAELTQQWHRLRRDRQRRTTSPGG